MGRGKVEQVKGIRRSERNRKEARAWTGVRVGGGGVC